MGNDPQYPIVSVKAIAFDVNGLVQNQTCKIFLSLLTVWLTRLSLFLGCFRSVNSHKSDVDFNVMALSLNGVAITNSCDFELTGETKGGQE